MWGHPGRANLAAIKGMDINYQDVAVKAGQDQ